MTKVIWRYREVSEEDLELVAKSSITLLASARASPSSGLPPNPLTVQTSSGYHCYYRHPGQTTPNTVRLKNRKVDIRGDGGYVIAPPSIHATGKKYEWFGLLSRSDIAEPPDWLVNIEVERIDKAIQSKMFDFHGGVEEGRRNDTAARRIGSLLRGRQEGEWESEVWPLVLTWNETNRPPLEVRELRATFDSITNRERGQRAKPYPTISIGQLQNAQEVQVEWVIEDLIPAKTITLLSGHPGSYKSFISLHVAISLATGGKVFGRFSTKRSVVLYVDEDSGDARLMKERLNLLKASETSEIEFIYRSGVRLDDKSSVDRLVRTVEDQKAGMVILDALVSLHDQDENASGQMRRVFDGVRRLVDAGAAVLIVHHRRKDGFVGTGRGAQSLRGSSDILAAADGHLMLDVHGEYVLVRQEKSRYSRPIAPFRVSIDPDHEQPFRYLGVEDGSNQNEKNRQQAILELLGENGLMWVREIESRLAYLASDKTLRKSLEVLTQSGSIEARIIDQKKFYQLKETTEGLETGTHP